ncbi:Cu(I)-responsive transcriptional regulator [Amylibacter sp. IMCC11727]|uniref:Cu(I)-responsive transcriptional regulator n=1 Tax=Amylibacter sp. IMCC11727 TaxID=3039851 RepID=UPI00244E387A|nr:Cu(I)-responsive transcriptional regulator [Amylibacter sp. IMCC11727]WGI22754.1 Cu(I)-responsive transcriptional regulator [Amylibacter sp. IMCC11727]
MYTIGAAAKRTDMPTKTIRYYADIGLVTPEERSDKGYRLYDDRALRRLIFVRRARAFGFSIETCRTLLALYTDQSRSSADVKSIALDHLAEIDEKLRELQTLRDELSHLADSCAGDERADCPILSALGNTS